MSLPLKFVKWDWHEERQTGGFAPTICEIYEICVEKDGLLVMGG